jgi:hypothetical protein
MVDHDALVHKAGQTCDAPITDIELVTFTQIIVIVITVVAGTVIIQMIFIHFYGHLIIFILSFCK